MLQKIENSSVNEFDVTAHVRVTDPDSVQFEIKRVLAELFPEENLTIVDASFDYFKYCYSGQHEDYHAVETPYHDIHHVMDVTLASVRLMAGHEIKHKDDSLGPQKVILGFIVSLFHDSGYLRYSDDYEANHGAEHTPVHVTRSGLFLERFLKANDMAECIDVAQTLVQFTGMEQDVDALKFEDKSWLKIGYMIGTADLMAQMADRLYAQKCHSHLYTEFSIAGMTEKKASDGSIEVIYADADDLLKKTPDFIEDALKNRLTKSFRKAYEYAAVYFGGRNLYMESIEKNRAEILKLTSN
jgi:hypothetical protein